MGKYAVVLTGLIFVGLGVYAVWSYMKKLRLLRIEGSEVIATIVNISGTRHHRKALITYTAAGKSRPLGLITTQPV